jgi:predicted N-acetyltransferase YhbS
LIIRDAINKDIDSIYEVVSLAFQEEQNVRDGEIIQARLVKELIKDNDDVVNLVAEDSVIVGHVFVSPVTLEPDSGLSCGQVSPLSVLPEFQSEGIGSALMQAVIKKSKNEGLDALFLLGDPNYYKKFGFVASGVKSAYGPSEYFQELELKASCLESLKVHVHLAPAFIRLEL